MALSPPAYFPLPTFKTSPGLFDFEALALPSRTTQSTNATWFLGLDPLATGVIPILRGHFLLTPESSLPIALVPVKSTPSFFLLFYSQAWSPVSFLCLTFCSFPSFLSKEDTPCLPLSCIWLFGRENGCPEFSLPGLVWPRDRGKAIEMCGEKPARAAGGQEAREMIWVEDTGRTTLGAEEAGCVVG